LPNYLHSGAPTSARADALIAESGEAAYRVVYRNALWSINQMLGKLEPRIYVLRRSPA
jgi:hypothetical protein